eukprot:jgi/Undpi1/10202/HiC_scaffold_28.g12655.m1
MRRGRRSGWVTAAAAITSAGIMARASSYCLSSVVGVYHLGPRTSPTAVVIAVAATATRGPSNTLVARGVSAEPAQSHARRRQALVVPTTTLNALLGRGGGENVGGGEIIYATSSRGADRTFPWPLAMKRPHTSCCRGDSNRPLGRRQRNAGLRRGLASSRADAGADYADEHGNGGIFAGMTGGRQVAEPGVVYFVATPIGNLEDITLRAINILRTADIIAAEDTRTAGSLLKLLGVERTGRLVSHHDHNTRRRVPEIVDAAREGKSVAVVSDAGTPGISDPGMELAEACAAEGVRVVPVPGACAAVAAISVSGFASHEFVFFGFVAGKRGSAVRRRKLEEIARESRTCVMYESPHRIADTLRGLLQADSSPVALSASLLPVVAQRGGGVETNDGGGGGAGGGGGGGGAKGGGGCKWSCRQKVGKGTKRPVMPIVLARELTKLHEEIFRGTLKEATDRYGGAGPKDPRGEFTVVLGPRDANRAAGGAGDGAVVLEARLMELTAGGMSTSSAVKMAAKDLNLKKSDVYRVALALTLPPSSN